MFRRSLCQIRVTDTFRWTSLRGSLRFSSNANLPGTGKAATPAKGSIGEKRAEEKWDEDVPKPNSKEGGSEKYTEYGNKPPGLEPTRFGDWQYKGRSTDF